MDRQCRWKLRSAVCADSSIGKRATLRVDGRSDVTCREVSKLSSSRPSYSIEDTSFDASFLSEGLYDCLLLRLLCASFALASITWRNGENFFLNQKRRNVTILANNRGSILYNHKKKTSSIPTLRFECGSHGEGAIIPPWVNIRGAHTPLIPGSWIYPSHF